MRGLNNGDDKIVTTMSSTITSEHSQNPVKTKVFPGYFSSRDDAIAEIAESGWWPVSWMDKPGSSYAAHYHIGAESLYLINGDLEFVDHDSGITYRLLSGDKLFLPARVVHSVSTGKGAAYILGLSCLTPFDDHFFMVE